MWASIISGLKFLTPKSSEPYHVKEVTVNAEKNADSTVAIAAGLAAIIVIVAAAVIFGKK